MGEFSLPANSKIRPGQTHPGKPGAKTPKGFKIYRWNPDDGKTPSLENAAETVMWITEKGGCSAVYHAIDEADVERIMRYPFTMVGSGSPAASRMVGAMSITWVNWERRPPASSMPFGQCTTVPLRVPPQCEATCLVHCSGVFMAQAQPTP